MNQIQASKNSIPARLANQTFAWLQRVAHHRSGMCLLVLVLTIAGRLALLHRIPIPKPFVTDEYSYLLGAETFSSGRWTNPAHPMWEHFETLHVLMRPSYMSKYPPGQALFLAMGWKLFGHPWFGVLISFGLFAATLCWMLQNWVPPVYALLGTAIALARISITGYWMNSYWGGAVAAVAGCLVLGALPRFVRKQILARDAIIMGIGLVLLAISRPYEGLMLGIAAGAALLFWRARRRLAFSGLFSLQVVLPLFLVLVTGASFDGYYHYKVTGSPWRLPYKVYFEQYQIASPWLIFPDRTPPAYRHAEIENTWREQAAEAHENRAHPIHNLGDARNIFAFYFPSIYLFPIALGLLLSRSLRFWIALGICASVWFTLLIESIKAPHYVAASAGLLPLLVVYGLRYLRFVSRNYGPLLVLVLAGVICLQGKAPEHGQSWETRSRGVKSPRMIAMGEALKQGGKHLILVRYAPDHVDKSDECVYNGADIDASQILWAHDMGPGKNRELIDYYHGGRKVWLFRPDEDPNRLIPYEPETR